MQVSGMELPDYHVNINEECSIEVTIQSKQSQTKATIQLSDNGEINSEKDTQTVDLVKGTQTISFKHTFLTDGLHRLNLKISVDEKEEFQENNEYYSYFNLEIFNEILILERVDGESAALQKILTENKAYDVEVKKISSAKAEELTDRRSPRIRSNHFEQYRQCRYARRVRRGSVFLCLRLRRRFVHRRRKQT